jgi:hypothetical protein
MLDRLFGIDLRSVALLRIIVGGYLLWDLADRARGLTRDYTDWGAFPREANVSMWMGGDYWERAWAFASFHMASGDAAWQVFLFLLAAVCAFFLMVGYRSRLFACLSWILMISLQNRNPIVLTGADQMIRHTIFWAMFLPLGARFSVDGLAAVCKAYQQSAPTRTLSIGSAGILLQTLFLYEFTAALKSAPEWHAEGTALYYALSIEHYQTTLGRLMLAMPIGFLKLSTWLTMGLEVVGPLLAFIPVATERIRLWLILLFVLFHLGGIGLLMDVGPICETSVFLWICFLPGLFWDKLSALWGRLPVSSFKTWLEAKRTGLIHWRNARIVQRVKRGEPLPELRSTKIAQVVAALCLVYILLWNLRVLDKKRYGHFIENLTWVASLVRLDQYWGMFAPFPFKNDGWLVLHAILEEGSEVDLMRGGQLVRWDKPDPVAATYVNERERKFLMNLYDQQYTQLRAYFVQYKMLEWLQAHPQQPNKRIRQINLYYMLHTTPPPGQPQPKPRKLLLFNESYTKV